MPSCDEATRAFARPPQAWAGDIGGLIYESPETVVLQHCAWIWAGDPNCTLPVEQQMYKPLPGGGAAVRAAARPFLLYPPPLTVGVTARSPARRCSS